MNSIPNISSIDISYECPVCEHVIARSVPYVEPKQLANPHSICVVKYVCKCGLPHELSYEIRKDKRIKLVDFICQEKSQLGKIKKKFKFK